MKILLMKPMFTFLFILCFSASYGQQLQLKEKYNSRNHRSLSFKTDRVKGSIKGSNASLSLTLKNTSEEAMDLSNIQLALVDATGRGAKLCGNTKILKPGRKTTLHLEACNGNDGLFMLNKAYASQQAFKEDAFFLRNKAWQLRIGQDVVTFYTDL